MSKILIDVRDDITPLVALTVVTRVMLEGRISAGDSFCSVSVLRYNSSDLVVHARRTRAGNDSFIVVRDSGASVSTPIQEVQDPEDILPSRY